MRFNFETNFIFCNLFQSKNTSDRFVYSCFGDITGQVIVKIDKETFGHEIELASGLELKFDKKGKQVNVDD